MTLLHKNQGLNGGRGGEGERGRGGEGLNVG